MNETDIQATVDDMLAELMQEEIAEDSGLSVAEVEQLAELQSV